MMDKRREQNLTKCEGKDELGILLTAETGEMIDQNRRLMAQDMERMMIQVVRKPVDGVSL